MTAPGSAYAAKRALALAAANLLTVIAEGTDEEQLAALDGWRAARDAAPGNVRDHHARMLARVARMEFETH